MDPFVPLPVGFFFFFFFFFLIVFLDERDPKLSRSKQEHKAIYTVSIMKSMTHVLPPLLSS